MSATYTSFRCPKCHIEIQATADMIGLTSECPACGERLVIPNRPASGVRRHGPDDPDPETVQAMKRRTIRIDLGDDL